MDLQIGKALALFGAVSAVAACSAPAGNATANASANMSETAQMVAEAQPCPDVMGESTFENWRARQSSNGVEREHNVLRIDGHDSYAWNEAVVDSTRLRQNLDLTGTMLPRPMLVVSVAAGADDPARQKAREAIYLAYRCRANF
jgi:hypothetical protein